MHGATSISWDLMKLSEVVIYLEFCGIQLIFVFSQYVEEPKG